MPPLTDDDVRWLLELMQEEDLAEIEVVQDSDRVLVRSHLPALAQVAAPVAVGPAPVAAPEQPAAPAVPSGTPVTSPMAGIFYRASSPDADPFVEVNDRVEAGQVVGMVEAMKLFNEVPSPVSGLVTKILADNEDRVEADQPLMYIQPVLNQE